MGVIHSCMTTAFHRFDWNHALSFLVASEAGSFSAAATQLGLSQPTVGRHVAALEEELGIALLERVGNELRLTAGGADLVAYVGEMRDAAERLSRLAAGHAEALEGEVSISASEAVSFYHLPAVIAQLRIDHPAIEIRLVTSNRASDLARREADIALRHFRPTQPGLVTRRLPDDVARFYASPSYLERMGRPRSVADLARLDLVSFDDVDAYLHALRDRGIPAEPSSLRLVASSHLAQWALCRAGAGVCVMSARVGDADPEVVVVYPELEPWPVPLWLTTHRELRTSRRIRVVFDRLAEALGG